MHGCDLGFGLHKDKDVGFRVREFVLPRSHCKISARSRRSDTGIRDRLFRIVVRFAELYTLHPKLSTLYLKP